MPTATLPNSSAVVKHDEVLKTASEQLKKLFDSVGMPESHGMTHCRTVMGHMDRAIEASSTDIKPARQLALKLAALLHEADDHKYFKNSSNAQDILKSSLSPEDDDRDTIIAEVVEMISYVSASANGNSVPDRAKSDPQLLWVRFCDRLEAIGPIGAVRCWQYNSEVGDPLSTPSTPRPITEKEVWSHVKPELFLQYMNGGSSASMMDHYYDKLLQIAVYDPSVVCNSYLVEDARKRVAPLVKVCLEFGKTGVPPVDLIKSYIQ